MTRVLKIKGRTGLFDTPSFIVTENESLKISLEFTDEIRIERFRLIVRHGDLKKTFTLSKNEGIELSPEWLKRNAENLDFSLVLLNLTESAIIKDDYQIEPLKLETADGNFTFAAMVQRMTEKQEEHEKKLYSLEERLKEFEEDGVPLLTENENAENECEE